MKQFILFLAALLIHVDGLSQIREEYRPLAEMLATLPEREPTEGNLVELLQPGTELLTRIEDDIMAAEESVHAEFFIFASDDVGNTIRTALSLKARDGEDVRFIADNFTTKSGFVNKMRKSGVQVKHHHVFPLRRRNHQKLLLLDHKVGYTGGMNIAYDNFYDWEDIMVRLRGPVLAKMERLYTRMWERHHGKASDCDIPVSEPYEGGVTIQSVDDDPSEKDRPNLKAYLWALENAREYFYAKSPYLKPPRELADAFAAAARRGVEVRLILPQDKDSIACIEKPFERVFYRDLVKAGVHIHLRTDKFDHSKMFVTDDYLCSTGSINLDALSLCYNYENNLYFYDEGIALQIKALIEDDLDKCYELTPEHIKAFPVWQKIFNPAFRVLGKLF